MLPTSMYHEANRLKPAIQVKALSCLLGSVYLMMTRVGIKAKTRDLANK